MERSAPKLADLVADDFPEPRFHFARRLVCKRYGYNVPWVRRATAERVENGVKLLLRIVKGVAQLLYRLFVRSDGNRLRIIRVPVFENKAYPLRKHGGFARPRSRKNEKRTVDRKHRFPLFFVQKSIFFIKKRALCFQIFGFYISSDHM